MYHNGYSNTIMIGIKSINYEYITITRRITGFNYETFLSVN